MNRENSIPTDNGEIEQINHSPDSPNQPSFPSQQQPENDHQRQTIIPTVHLDSLLNHNHTDIDEDGKYSYRILSNTFIFLDRNNSPPIDEQPLSAPSIPENHEPGKIIFS